MHEVQKCKNEGNHGTNSTMCVSQWPQLEQNDDSESIGLEAIAIRLEGDAIRVNA